MKKILTLIIVLNCVQLFSQIKFQKGYIIYNNEKKECLIQNDNWLKTPTTITYKLSINGPTIVRDVNKIQELYIYNTNQKYLLTQVQLIHNKKQAKKEKRFLKCLLSGEASLFSYMDKGKEQFFFKINNSNIIHLEYFTSVENGKIKENNWFKQQLFNRLKCNSVTEKKLKTMTYNKKDILNIFKNYNSCKKIEYKDFDQNRPKGKLYLSILSGTSLFEFGNLDMNLNGNDGITMSSKNSLKVGLDAEFRFPFNRNKWGVFSELNYSKHAGRGSFLLTTNSSAPSNPGGIGKAYFSFTTDDITVLEIPIGFRYYSFINSKSSLFYNAALSYNILLSNKGEIKYDTALNDKLVEDSEIMDGIGLNFGVGYKYNSTYGIEIRYSQMDIVRIKTLNGSSKNISFLITYKI